MSLQRVIKHLQGKHPQASHSRGKGGGKKAKTSVKPGGKNITGKVTAGNVEKAIGRDTPLKVKGRQSVTATNLGNGRISIGAGRDFSTRISQEVADVINAATGF